MDMKTVRTSHIVIAVGGLVLSIAFAEAVEGQTRVQLPPPIWTSEVEFTDIVSVLEFREGILVADRGENRFTSLTPEGRRRQFVGGRGPGPEEYGTVGRLFRTGARSALFPDVRSGTVKRIGYQGITEQVRIPGSMRGSGRLVGGDEAGHLLFLHPARPSDSVAAVLARIGHEQLDTVALMIGIGTDGFVRLPATEGQSPWMIGNNPLATRGEALLFPDGWTAIVSPDPYGVDWRSPEGQWTEGGNLPFERTAVTDRHKCAMLEQWWGDSRPCQADLLPAWPEVLPPYLYDPIHPTLFATPEGHLVIKRTAVFPDEGERYDVIGRQGEILGGLELLPGETLVGFGEESVYIAATGDFDLEKLTRRPWPKFAAPPHPSGGPPSG